jgi:transcriptional regulator with XRE-family HTH domain
MLKTDVARAMIRARTEAGLTLEEFAGELQRLAPRLDMSPQLVAAMEREEWSVFAEHLLAASRISGQPVSALLGEMELVTVTLPQLLARLSAVERRLEVGGADAVPKSA